MRALEEPAQGILDTLFHEQILGLRSCSEEASILGSDLDVLMVESNPLETRKSMLIRRTAEGGGTT